MDVLCEIANALWHQDFAALANPNVIWIVYGVMFLTLLLENGLLPAAFLPGDSLLLLAGAMIAKGVMSFIPTMIILTTAASIGCWLSYLQGRWLGNTRLVKSWLDHLPQQYHQRARQLFNSHGLMALLIGRFLAFVRTILPTLAGMSGLKNGRFQLFNWLSGLLWVAILVGSGYGMSQLPFIKRHEDQMMACLLLLPLVLLSVGLIGTLALVMRNKKARRSPGLRL